MTVDNDIREIRTEQVEQGKTIAIIKDAVCGNGGEGLVKKVGRLERYLYMTIGGAGLIGVVLGLLKIM